MSFPMVVAKDSKNSRSSSTEFFWKGSLDSKKKASAALGHSFSTYTKYVYVSGGKKC